uniref:Uncharacterized protein n=1 Tax=Trypanosoma congolense (strain IL3000) TaxID=1068625 RepID=G0UNB0_TRYCI|nr:hypothetical protein, unlikely [Trypanosoma congolense IL3000]
MKQKKKKKTRVNNNNSESGNQNMEFERHNMSFTCTHKRTYPRPAHYFPLAPFAWPTDTVTTTQCPTCVLSVMIAIFHRWPVTMVSEVFSPSPTHHLWAVVALMVAAHAGPHSFIPLLLPFSSCILVAVTTNKR